MLEVLSSTTNLRQPLADKYSLGYLLHCRRPPKHYLAVKGIPLFIVKLNISNITVVDPMSLTSFLQGEHLNCLQI